MWEVAGKLFWWEEALTVNGRYGYLGSPCQQCRFGGRDGQIHGPGEFPLGLAGRHLAKLHGFRRRQFFVQLRFLAGGGGGNDRIETNACLFGPRRGTTATGGVRQGILFAKGIRNCGFDGRFKRRMLLSGQISADGMGEAPGPDRLRCFGVGPAPDLRLAIRGGGAF